MVKKTLIVGLLASFVGLFAVSPGMATITSWSWNMPADNVIAVGTQINVWITVSGDTGRGYVHLYKEDGNHLWVDSNPPSGGIVGQPVPGWALMTPGRYYLVLEGNGALTTPLFTVVGPPRNVRVTPSVVSDEGNFVLEFDIDSAPYTDEMGWRTEYSMYTGNTLRHVDGNPVRVIGNTVSYPIDIQLKLGNVTAGDYWFIVRLLRNGSDFGVLFTYTGNILTISPPVVTITYPLEGDVLSSATIPVEGSVNQPNGTLYRSVTSVDVTINGNTLNLDTAGRFEGIAIEPKEEIEVTVSAVDGSGNTGSTTVGVVKVHDMRKPKP